MRYRKVILALALMAAATLVPWRAATAQPYDGVHLRAVATLCAWDLDRYCGLAAGRAGHLVCLARRAESLSPPCYRALRLAAAVDGCAGDVRRYCGRIPAGGGRIAARLRGNADRLSAACLRALRGPGPHAGLPRHAVAGPDRPDDAPDYGPDAPMK